MQGCTYIQSIILYIMARTVICNTELCALVLILLESDQFMRELSFGTSRGNFAVCMGGRLS